MRGIPSGHGSDIWPLIPTLVFGIGGMVVMYYASMAALGVILTVIEKARTPPEKGKANLWPLVLIVGAIALLAFIGVL